MLRAVLSRRPVPIAVFAPCPPGAKCGQHRRGSLPSSSEALGRRSPPKAGACSAPPWFPVDEEERELKAPHAASGAEECSARPPARQTDTSSQCDRAIRRASADLAGATRT